LEGHDVIREGYGRKKARNNGMVAQILAKTQIPKMCRVRQKFDGFQLTDIEGEVTTQLQRAGSLDRIRPGQAIAVAVGSRGIANIGRITHTVITAIKRMGATPFIVPAMGSHGGATAEGQVRILESYGITEAAMSCPIRATMDTVLIGCSDWGLPVYIDRYASQADGIVIICRVKPHTAFRGRYESGLLKMTTIGLGKQKGAEVCHTQGFGQMEKNLMANARVILENCRVLFGVAALENAYDQTRRIAVMPVESFFDEEPSLLKEAKKYMPSILIKEFDVLVIDEAGKNISGDGMDPNITGNFCSPYASGGAVKQRTVLLDLTAESHGNAGGFGMVDFSVQRAFDKMDFEMTYPNIITPTVPGPGKIPVILANDQLAIKAGIQTCNGIDYRHPRVVRIKNTLKMGEIMISESLVEEARTNPRMEILEEPAELIFDQNGNLF
jgi:hypothetical protein